MWLFFVLGCKPLATPVDACEPEAPVEGVCTPCEVDTDCVFTGNACFDTVTCAHLGDSLAFPLLGCSDALTYEWPDDDDCACVAGTCSATTGP